MSELAVYGGTAAISNKGLIKPWPPIDKTDKAMVLDALCSGRPLSRSVHNIELEKEFAAWNGSKYAIFTNSGTSALHMGLVGCGIGAGDHVLVTAYSWSSSATCILHHNAIPIFVDIDFDTMLIDPDKIEAAITPRTKAIIAVHLHGLPAQMGRIMAIAKQHHLHVIEDACQAHGAMFEGKKTGTLGHAGAFSLNHNKCLCAGEGGIFVCDDEKIYRQACSLWSFGETRKPEESRDYHAYALGWMYRGNELTAALTRSQLKKYPQHFETLRANAQALDKVLQGTPYLIRPVEPKNCTHNWYNYNMRIDFDALGYDGDKTRFRDAVCKAINAEGVGCNPWQRFILPEMTVFQAKNAYGNGCPWSIPGADEGVDYTPSRFPVAKKHCESHIPLVMPLRAPNTTATAKKVAAAIRKVFERIKEIDPDKILEQK